MAPKHRCRHLLQRRERADDPLKMATLLTVPFYALLMAFTVGGFCVSSHSILTKPCE